MGRVKIENPKTEQLYLRASKEEIKEIDSLKEKNNFSSRSHFFRTAVDFFKEHLKRKNKR